MQLQTTYHYFDLLEDILKKSELLHKLSLSFNADKSIMPLQHTHVQGLAPKDERVCCVSSGVKTLVTMLCCTNVVGYTIQPLVIFQ